jgi:SAM-dependent methyltransferase
MMMTNSFAPTIRSGRFDGVLKILRFNWPQYVAGAGVVAFAAAIVTAITLPAWLDVLAWAGVCVAAFWLIASLAVSFYVYDLSPLYRWSWISEILPEAPARWVNIHMGLDDSTAALRRLFPSSAGRSFDAFDEREMSEPSIHRARRLAMNSEPAERVSFSLLPLAAVSCDAVFLILSAHELRYRRSQEQFFREVSRIVRPGGTVLLVEHLRDGWNFLAFGPSFIHFWPARRWASLASGVGLKIEKRRRITPFVAVFVLRKPERASREARLQPQAAARTESGSVARLPSPHSPRPRADEARLP